MNTTLAHTDASLVWDEVDESFQLVSQITRTQRIAIDRDGGMLRNGLEDLLADRGHVVVADRRVLELNPQFAIMPFEERNLLAMPFDEEAKALETVELVLRFASERELPRRGVFVAIGGGSCTDVVGLAASLFRRGAPHIKVPTTLMGMVDAGIATKNGVNFHGAKNRVGTFHPPEVTIVTPLLLRTLPARHIANGLAECVKLAVIGDEPLFRSLTNAVEFGVSDLVQVRLDHLCSIVTRSISTMLQCLSDNLYEENSLERSVDFGHTISPALEIMTGGQLLHGEAVAIDIAFHAALAHQLGYIDATDEASVLILLRKLNLPVWHSLIDVDFLLASYRNALAHRGGRLNLPMPNRIGNCVFLGMEAITEASIRHAIERARCHAAA